MNSTQMSEFFLVLIHRVSMKCNCLHRETTFSNVYILSYRKASIYAKDQTLCTPVLTAAANKKVEAFHCLMEFINLKDDQRNPVFQVLHVKKHRVETLEVSLHIVSRLALVGC